MRILQVGDIHCDKKKLMLLKSVSREYSFDLLAVHGDVECNSEIISILKDISSSIVFVPGNMDSYQISELYSREGFNIDSRVVEFRGYYIAGVG
ncbi:MAG: metallophosphoesterase, partial [Sulfolobales archaeon]